MKMRILTWRGCVTSLNYDNIRPNYFLIRWQYYEAARHELNSLELIKAKVFFNALKKLDEEHLSILTDIFYFSRDYTLPNKRGYHPTVRAVSSSTLAEKYGVSVDKIHNMRREAQFSLKREMQKIMKQISEQFKLRLHRNLYFIDFVPESSLKKKYIVGPEDEGKVFNQSEFNSDQVMALRVLGFEIIPIIRS